MPGTQSMFENTCCYDEHNNPADKVIQSVTGFSSLDNLNF